MPKSKKRAGARLYVPGVTFTGRGVVDPLAELLEMAGRFNEADLAEARRVLAELVDTLNHNEHHRALGWWQAGKVHADRLTAALDARARELGLTP